MLFDIRWDATATDIALVHEGGARVAVKLPDYDIQEMSAVEFLQRLYMLKDIRCSPSLMQHPSSPPIEEGG